MVPERIIDFLKANCINKKVLLPWGESVPPNILQGKLIGVNDNNFTLERGMYF